MVHSISDLFLEGFCWVGLGYLEVVFSMKSCIFSSYCRVGRITREFPLSAEATVASLWISFVWIDFNVFDVHTHLPIYLQEKYFNTRVGTLIVATIYLQLIQNTYMFRSFTVLQCSHQHCVQPVVSDVEVVGYL